MHPEGLPARLVAGQDLSPFRKAEALFRPVHLLQELLPVVGLKPPPPGRLAQPDREAQFPSLLAQVQGYVRGVQYGI